MKKSEVKIKRNDLRETVIWLVDNDPEATTVVLAIVKRLLGEPLSQDEVLKELFDLHASRIELFERTVKQVKDFDAELTRLAKGIEDLTNERDRMAFTTSLYEAHINSLYNDAKDRCKLHLERENKEIDQAFHKLGVHIKDLVKTSFIAVDSLRNDIQAQALRTLHFWSIGIAMLTIILIGTVSYVGKQYFDSFIEHNDYRQRMLLDNQLKINDNIMKKTK